jgi:hypothetical protein
MILVVRLGQLISFFAKHLHIILIQWLDLVCAMINFSYFCALLEWQEIQKFVSKFLDRSTR